MPSRPDRFAKPMPSRFCCAKCFHSPNLIHYIKEHGTQGGDCDFCGAEDVTIISPRQLAEPMEELLQFYHPAEPDQDYAGAGMLDATDFPSLAKALQDDWDFFNGSVDNEVWNELLDEIRAVRRSHPDDDFIQESALGWSSKDRQIHSESGENLWAEFADQIKSQRRFIFTDRFARPARRPEAWIADAVQHLGAVHVLGVETQLYRARKDVVAPSTQNGWQQQPFPAKEMGAPPAHLAAAARANPQGIPMFYAALERDTAVVEAGRFPGVKVSVRQVRPTRTLRVVDLMRLQSIPDPIGISNIASVLWKNGLLNHLNRELSRPVHPDDSAIEYIPTQYLAEAIRNAGFDGILYRSAMRSGGRNVVIFDPDDMRVLHKNAEIVSIESIEFSLSSPGPRKRTKKHQA